MTASPWSLKRRLLLWLLLPMLAAAVLVMTDTARRARTVADTAYDRLLTASALAISERVVVEAGRPEIDLPYVALEMLSSTSEDRVFYKVTGPDGELITGYRDLPAAPQGIRLAEGDPVFYDAAYRGEPVRIALIARRLNEEPAAKGWLTVQVAQTRGERALLAQRIVINEAEQLAIVLAVGGLALWLAIGRSLSPLAALQATLGRRAPSDLAPIEDKAPAEVHALVDAINQLLSRLSANHAAMRRFIADASHQLRTPLAGLRTQVELALREPGSAAVRGQLERLHAMTKRTSRLAEQLLNEARAEGDKCDLHGTADLARLTKEATRELVPAALARGVDLGFEGPRGPVPVPGDAVLLQEMITNVIDNAVRYTSEGGHVTVRLAAPPNAERVRLEVEDTGPGIPVQDRARVFERFYRMPGSPGSGAGLGLAIAAATARRHGGKITLADGPGGRGLSACIELPASRAVESAGLIDADAA